MKSTTYRKSQNRSIIERAVRVFKVTRDVIPPSAVNQAVNNGPGRLSAERLMLRLTRSRLTRPPGMATVGTETR